MLSKKIFTLILKFLSKKRKEKLFKSIGVYQIDSQVFMQVYSRTVAGVRTLDGPVLSRGREDTNGLGEGILATFENYKEGLPDYKPGDDNTKNDPMLQETKMKTWNRLQNNSLSFSIYEEDGIIRFVPMKFNGSTGPNRGYEWLDEKTIKTDDHSPENLGRCLLEALKLSENRFLNKNKD